MISDDYILGFVEGEGCFSVAIQKYIDKRPRKTNKRNKVKKRHCGFRINPSFRITIVEKDRVVLEEIKTRLGVGQIYVTERKGNEQNVTQYYTQNFDDSLKIAEFFKKFMFYTTKGKDFRIWTEILEIIRKREHLTKEGIIKICELRDQMNIMQGKNHKRTTKEIVETLDVELERPHNTPNV